MRVRVECRYVATPAGALTLGDVVDTDIHPLSEDELAPLVEKGYLVETDEEPSDLDLVDPEAGEAPEPASPPSSEPEYDGPSARELHEQVVDEVEEEIPTAASSVEEASVDSIKGVGASTRETLEEAGYATVGDILAATEEELDEVDLPPSLSGSTLKEKATLFVSTEVERELEPDE